MPAQTQALPESDFHLRVDAILEAIETAIDSANLDIDSELSAGILTLEFADGSKVIINRQTPNREIWLAARSGGFHFRLGESGHWCDTRSGDTLAVSLARAVSAQAGSTITFELPV